MEDDTELLDWGHEEEDSTAVHGSGQRTFSVDDAEDAVSLGGDEEDEFLTYQSRVPQDTAHRAYSPPKSRQTRQESLRGHNDSPRPHHSQDLSNERMGLGDQSSLPGRMHSLGTLVHALPPKPVLSSVPFVHPSHPSIIEATAMASRADREKRNGTGSKTSVYDHNDSLPPGWEVKHPRSGRGIYYYNVHTQESTWTRPTAPTIREKRSERTDRRDDLDKPMSTRNENIISRVGRAESGDMSYGDRHYRPGEPGWREERPAPTQLIDSYIPDSYSPNHRNNRPSPPPPRARERESTPPPHRPLSSAGSFGDRDGIQSSHREASSLAPLSAEDRVWVARNSVAHEHPREHRQREDPTLLEAERRNLPRDTERPSTLRPKSPASYTRRPQESANVAPHSSHKPTQPLSGASPERKSRFSQTDSPAQYRQLESRDPGMRRAHTDDIPSHGARYVDDVPSSRPMSDVHGNEDAPTHPTSDAQRPGSWGRTALPPQDEAFRPGPRSVPSQRGGHYPLGPASSAPAPVPLNRYTSRVIPDDVLRDSARRSPSPPASGPPTERDDRDRGRSRWPKPYVNGPSQMDSRTMHESSRNRTHDAAMDVDEVPSLRSSDPPAKQIPPRRSGLQDEVPRYPRAMLNSDGDGLPRGVREARDGTDSRHRFAVDDSFRFGSSRDRQGTERHFTDQTISQKEPIRGVEAKPPPPGSNIKLSGTNNIPIGARNKFAGNVPFAPVPPNTTHRAAVITSGGNDEYIAARRDRVNRDHERAPHLDSTVGDRSGLVESTRREDTRRSPPTNPVLPHTEPPLLLIRPSRAALGISRFGPPLVKGNTEPVRTQMSVSSESLPSEKVPEGSTHATPPPPSRESSTASFNDVAAPPVRPPHLPLRPASPRGYRQRPGDVKPYYHPSTRSPGARDARGSDVSAEVPAHPRPSSPLPRRHATDAYPSGPPPAFPPATRDNRGDRDAHDSERPRANFRDSGAERHVARILAPLVVQDEIHDRALMAMHPERALMLQTNGLPPRPPSALGRTRSVKGLKRERLDERDHDRAEPLRGAGGGRYRSASPPGSERRRYPEGDRSMGHAGGSGLGGGGGGGGGASLLDRLSMDDGSRINSPSLRDRVQLPSKRDREEMLAGDFSVDPEGDDYDASKRVRKRGGPKMRRGRV